MKMIQTAETFDDISYTLTRKQVKNINLRVRRDGSVAVSAPLRASPKQIALFLAQKHAWILNAQARAREIAAAEAAPCRVTKEQALALFTRVSEEIFPLFTGVLHGQRPMIKVRLMKTRWGVCVPAKRQITLNQRLAEKPRAAVEYVVMHEYAHFIAPDHGPQFYAVLQRLMPDYAVRRAALK